MHISRRHPVTRKLDILIAGKVAGVLREHGLDYMSFDYDDGYQGPPLSVSIPDIPASEHLDLDVRPVVEGLLPDNPATRLEMARRAGLSDSGPFSLLGAYGKDLPGAVQACPPEETASVLRGEGRYVPVSDREIAERLAACADMSSPAWHGPHETWSLGGNQGKFALARVSGSWMRCEGAYPSTHILKPGVSGMPHQALVEFLTMRCADTVGLAVAQTEYAEFDGMGAIVVKRYDRIDDGMGNVRRIHQEDLCQALGYLPEDKYTVTTSDAVSLLRGHADAPSTARFAHALMYNYLVGGIDAHAKNYSLLHPRESIVTLAPLYDLASVLPYEKVTASRWRKVPMTIGGVNKIGALTGSDIGKLAASCDLDGDMLRAAMRALCERIPDALHSIVSANGHIPNIGAVGEEMLRTVSANCAAMLANINRSHALGSFVRPGLDIINGGTLPRSAPVSDAPYSPVLAI